MLAKNDRDAGAFLALAIALYFYFIIVPGARYPAGQMEWIRIGFENRQTRWQESEPGGLLLTPQANLWDRLTYLLGGIPSINVVWKGSEPNIPAASFPTSKQTTTPSTSTGKVVFRVATNDPHLKDRMIQNYEKFWTDIQQVGQSENVPPLAIAWLWYIESRVTACNPSNGQGLFQLYDRYRSGERFTPGKCVDSTEFQRQARLAAQHLKGKASKGPLSANMPLDSAALEWALYGYNGRAYGPNVENSPYIMAWVDAQHRSMSMARCDGCSPSPGPVSFYGWRAWKKALNFS